VKIIVKATTIAIAFLMVGGLLFITTTNGSAQSPTSGQIGIGNLTAKVIAYHGETITGQVNATGYTFGVYIGPGVTDVLIYHAHVFGADDHGILAVDTTGVSVMYSNVSYDVLHPVPSILDHKAIGFYGVSNSYIIGNTITHNAGDGGIAVYSSSSLVPTGLPIPNVNASGNDNFIADNYVADDSQGCGIVVAAWGPGMTVANNWIFQNKVMGDFLTPHGPTGFSVGTIVVAADFPFSSAVDNVVLDNTVIGGLEDGIIVNAVAPGAADIGNEIAGNYVQQGAFQRLNNPPFDNASDLDLAPAPNAIAIIADMIPQNNVPSPPIAQGNTVVDNTIADESIGIWVANAQGGAYIGNTFENVTTNFQSFYGVG
jgi:hypothetical protein